MNLLFRRELGKQSKEVIKRMKRDLIMIHSWGRDKRKIPLRSVSGPRERFPKNLNWLINSFGQTE